MGNYPSYAKTGKCNPCFICSINSLFKLCLLPILPTSMPTLINWEVAVATMLRRRSLGVHHVGRARCAADRPDHLLRTEETCFGMRKLCGSRLECLSSSFIHQEREREREKRNGSVSKPCTPGEHQNSWQMDVHPTKMVLIGIDPYPNHPLGSRPRCASHGESFGLLETTFHDTFCEIRRSTDGKHRMGKLELVTRLDKDL